MAAKIAIYLPVRKKSRGFIEKLEYRCTTRNLPLCNGTIIVVKITLLHSVSVITNVIISKRYKQIQTDKKHHTFPSTAIARPILGMVIEEVCPVFAPQLFLIRSVVLPLWVIENLRDNAPTVGKCL